MGLTEVKPGVVFGWVDHGVDRVLDWAKCGLWYMDWTRGGLRLVGGLDWVYFGFSLDPDLVLFIKSQGPKM